MPTFLLRLLGSPGVSDSAGDPTDLPLGKPLAALCYVALESTGVRRSDLARILWPSSTEAKAKASIRQALWLIRKQTHPAIIEEREGELVLNTDIARTDLAEFARELAQGRVAEAFQRWNGGPLRGFGIPDAPPWLAWADEVRSRWESRLGQALEDRAEAAHGPERATWLEYALEVRPHRVESWAMLVRTRVELREAEHAEAALARLRQIADEDDAEVVRDAVERLRLLRRAAYGDPDERLVPEFVGRSEAFSVLMDAWHSALSGRSRVVGIAGPAGIGKTALATEVVRHVEVDDAVVVDIGAVKTEASLEWGVLGTVVADLLQRPGSAGTSPGSAQVLRALVPSRGDSAAPPPRAAVLADAVADLLGAVAHEAPILLFVDDAHWIDSSSAIVLLRAMRQLHGAAVVMLWTCRENGGGAPHHGMTALRDAVAHQSARLVRLDPLTPGEVREMVTLLLTGVEPEMLDALSDRIHQLSQGSPLHVVEILQGMRDRSLLGRDPEGRWILAQDATLEGVELPTSLATALAQRVAGLPEHARAMGAALAASGGARTPGQLRAAARLAEADADQALATLLGRDLLRWTRDDRLHLAHDTLRDAFLHDRPVGVAASGVRRRWPAWGTAAAAILALGAYLLWPEAAPPAPHGGGTLWVRTDRAFRPYRFVGGADLWQIGDSIIIPDGMTVTSYPALLSVDGRTTRVIPGYSADDLEDAPEAVLFRDGRIDTIATGPGDASVIAIGPDQHTALLNVQNPDTLRYRTTAVRVDVRDPRRRQTLGRGERGYPVAGWTPDGRYVLIKADAPWDTVIVSDPAGHRVAVLPGPTPEVAGISACGPSAALVAVLPPGELLQLYRWSWPDDRLQRLTPAQRPDRVPTCSPDGSAFAYTVRSAGIPTLTVQLFGGPIVARRPLDARQRLVGWEPPPSAPPGSVVVSARGDGSLPRGGRRPLTARVFDIEGREMARDVTWTSDDPAVASARDGLLTANRPGVTIVRAIVDGWIEDSLRVRVDDTPVGASLAFADSFPTLDTLRWYPVGDPLPIAVLDDEGRPALDLNGDGRYSDGIVSRADFALETGATLEVTFRLDGFRRPDRDRLSICLMEAAPGVPARNPALWRIDQNACLIWPSLAGPVDVDTAAVRLSRHGVALGAIPVGTLLRTGRWNRMALQLRADGQISAVVNDSVVGAHPVATRNDGTRWRISIRGAAVDTRLLLRDVTLWREERFGIPGG